MRIIINIPQDIYENARKEIDKKSNTYVNHFGAFYSNAVDVMDAIRNGTVIDWRNGTDDRFVRGAIIKNKYHDDAAFYVYRGEDDSKGETINLFYITEDLDGKKICREVSLKSNVLLDEKFEKVGMIDLDSILYDAVMRYLYPINKEDKDD